MKRRRLKDGIPVVFFDEKEADKAFTEAAPFIPYIGESVKGWVLVNQFLVRSNHIEYSRDVIKRHVESEKTYGFGITQVDLLNVIVGVFEKENR